jgi:hypothetical protein|tara:strand:+ start:1121 stop:1648 length:528 start_codon:yes stop_codon:yes gene_type:complete
MERMESKTMARSNNIKIVDNFLPIDIFKDIQAKAMDLPYFYSPNITFENFAHIEEKFNFYLTHVVYDNNVPNSPFFKDMQVIIDKMGEDLFLKRIKINFYPRTERLIIHDKHRDNKKSHKGAIFSLNTCNGGTYVGDKFIASVENRMLFFDPSQFHSSTTCTDKHARFNINFNYF